jgi:hypothetical protein
MARQHHVCSILHGGVHTDATDAWCPGPFVAADLDLRPSRFGALVSMVFGASALTVIGCTGSWTGCRRLT